MSDPASLDPLAIGGGGLAGAGFVAGVVRLMVGGAMRELERRMDELKTDVKGALVEQRADTREQISSLKEMIQRSDERHDDSIRRMAVLEQTVHALHQRLDVLERKVD